MLEGSTDRGSGNRTISLLKLAAEAEGAFTLGQLAVRANLPASSVHRLLQPLLREGLIERGEGQSYQIGREMLRVALLVTRKADYGRLARPILRRLWSRWEESCSFCIYKPESLAAIVLETIQTQHPLRFAIEPLSEISLTWGSLGRSILASLPEEARKAATQRPGLGPLSGLPPPTADDIAKVVAEVWALGYAHYRNASFDVAGVAAPVFRADGSILGSIGVTAPAQRLLPEHVPAIAQDIISAARELSELMGYTAAEQGTE